MWDLSGLKPKPNLSKRGVAIGRASLKTAGRKVHNPHASAAAAADEKSEELGLAPHKVALLKRYLQQSKDTTSKAARRRRGLRGALHHVRRRVGGRRRAKR
eukprot:Selendium_serpulae@DN11734_c0_g1_i1.p2